MCESIVSMSVYESALFQGGGGREVRCGAERERRKVKCEHLEILSIVRIHVGKMLILAALAILPIALCYQLSRPLQDPQCNNMPS